MSIVEIQRVLSEQPKIASAWLFGSTLSGRTRPDSDVDVAVWSRSPLTWQEASALQMDLVQVVGHDRVDLVMLNEANCILRFEAISGRNLLCRNPEAQAGLASLTAREYEEEMARLSARSA